MAKEKKKTERLTEEGRGTKGSALWGILLFSVLILIDQVTKALADAYLDRRAPIELVKGWLNLTIVHNPGISYGLASDLPEWGKLLIVAMTAVIMAGLAVLYFRLDKNRALARCALVFIVAGGVGNLIDRVYYRVWTLDAATAETLGKGVRDMVDLSRFGFAVCNFADFFITAGVILLALSFLFFDKEAFFPVGKYKKLKAAEEAEKEKNSLSVGKSSVGESENG